VRRPPLDFDEFYAASSRRLLPALIAATGDLHEAEDCLQEAFVRAAMRWRSVRASDNPEAWVRRVALNLAVDGHRRRSVRRRLGRYVAPLGEVEAPGEATVDVIRAVAQLPGHERHVIVLHYLLDMPISAVALELGRPENTIKTQLLRARTRLSDLLATADEGPVR
jgi:RNA polymerase sigma-70 factor (ECF subfamily)